MGSLSVNLKERIDQLREERGMLLRDLGSAIGVSEKGLHDIFRRNDCKLATIIAICELFGIGLCEFFNGPMDSGDSRVPEQTRALMRNLEEARKRVVTLEHEAELLRMLIQAKDQLIEVLNKKV